MVDILGIIAPHPPIMVPTVGGQDSSVTAASMEALRRAARVLDAFDPETVVIMSPHSPAAQDAFVIDTAPRTSGSFDRFGAAGARYSYATDVAFASALLDALGGEAIDAIDRSIAPALEPGLLDHGVLVPMSFLDPTGRWPIVNISLSWLSYRLHRRLGQIIAATADRIGRRIAFVASGDCSHRLKEGAPAGYSPRAAEFDQTLVDLIGRGDFDALMSIDPALVEAAGECGLRSFITLGGVIPGAATTALSYESPWGVGYLTALAAEPALLDRLLTPEVGAKGGLPGSDESEPVALARRAVETYVRERRVIEPGSPEGLLGTRAGAFVSLHREHDLRGCIGTIAPTAATLAEEIVHNAIQAATADPRFPELTSGELADLDISVDVLHEPEPAEFQDLHPSRYGVIVTADWRRGLLLPDLEGVDTPEQQVAIAMRKAGISPGERVRLERFLVDRYH
ncbi:MAG: AmmeMemoRadiSam system protein A [Actinobacteria bacterium]|nr:MAG: AmmeMemoRadiSam system protein A [Actinomycetota bacterium]